MINVSLALKSSVEYSVGTNNQTILEILLLLFINNFILKLLEQTA